jgi:uncharacterized membrane protein YdfJ with MMPL/SSD domain
LSIRPLPIDHRIMTSGINDPIPAPPRAIAALLIAVAVLVTAAICFLGVANANAAPAGRSDAFGAAVRVAAGNAAARLALGQHVLTPRQHALTSSQHALTSRQHVLVPGGRAPSPG